MGKNSLYNDFLNSGDIIIGASGCEGFGLPEFNSIALGKHSVILNAHAYKEYATPENSCLFEPSSKIPVYDNMFFHQGTAFNQGNIFDWNEDYFINACERAIQRTRLNRVNTEGLKLQTKFTVKKTVDEILKYF